MKRTGLSISMMQGTIENPEILGVATLKATTVSHLNFR